MPPSLRGKLARFEIEAGSPQVEAFVIRVKFRHARELDAEYLLEPYLHPNGGKDFFALAIPAAAETCGIHLRFPRNARPSSSPPFARLSSSASGAG